MQTLKLTTNGIYREFDGKQFGNEFRVYRIRGDVTDREELVTAAQEIALETGCESVRMPF